MNRRFNAADGHAIKGRGIVNSDSIFKFVYTCSIHTCPNRVGIRLWLEVSSEGLMPMHLDEICTRVPQ